MTKKEFFHMLKDVPDDYHLHLSKVVWLDKEEGFSAMLCTPILGYVTNDECKEFCFLIDPPDKSLLEDLKNVEKIKK